MLICRTIGRACQPLPHDSTYYCNETIVCARWLKIGNSGLRGTHIVQRSAVNTVYFRFLFKINEMITNLAKRKPAALRMQDKAQDGSIRSKIFQKHPQLRNHVIHKEFVDLAA